MHICLLATLSHVLHSLLLHFNMLQMFPTLRLNARMVLQATCISLHSLCAMVPFMITVHLPVKMVLQAISLGQLSCSAMPFCMLQLQIYQCIYRAQGGSKQQPALLLLLSLCPFHHHAPQMKRHKQGYYDW